MRQLIVITGLILFAGCQQPAPAPVPSASPVVAFRSRLTVGETDPLLKLDRNWTYLSTYDGTMGSWTFDGQPIADFSLGEVQEWYDAATSGGITIPDNTQPGQHTIDTGAAGGPVTITVKQAPFRRTITIPPGASAAAVQVALSKGFLDITLAPGVHVWDTFVILSDDVVIRGYGATIRRAPVVNLGTNWPAFYVGGNDVGIYGCRFVYDVPGQVFFSATAPHASGLVVADCTFERCNLGFYFANALIRDCEFRGGGSIIAPSGLFWRCRHLGANLIDSFQFWQGDLGSIKMIDCSFDGTNRGVVFNAAWGPITDAFFSGVECRGIIRGANGNECWSCEGGPVKRMTVFHCKMRGCESPSFQFDGGADQVYIRDFAQDGGFGTNLEVNHAANPNATITNVTVQDFQYSRCGVYAGPYTSGVRFIDGSIIGFMPTRGNQTWNNPSPLAASRTIAAWANGPNAGTNILTRVGIIATPQGMKDNVGFTVGE